MPRIVNQIKCGPGAYREYGACMHKFCTSPETIGYRGWVVKSPEGSYMFVHLGDYNFWLRRGGCTGQHVSMSPVSRPKLYPLNAFGEDDWKDQALKYGPWVALGVGALVFAVAIAGR